MTEPVSISRVLRQIPRALDALCRPQGRAQGGGQVALASLIGMGLIVAVEQLTQDRIARHQNERRNQILSELLPLNKTSMEALREPVRIRDARLEEPELEVYRLKDPNGEPCFFMETATRRGYNGTIRYALATDRTGRVIGVRVLHHRETPGLGDLIERARSDWILGFNGRSLAETPAEHWTVRRDGGDFDQFTGATVTPRALAKSLALVLKVLADHPEIQETESPASTSGDPNSRTGPWP